MKNCLILLTSNFKVIQKWNIEKKKKRKTIKTLFPRQSAQTVNANVSHETRQKTNALAQASIVMYSGISIRETSKILRSSELQVIGWSPRKDFEDKPRTRWSDWPRFNKPSFCSVNETLTFNHYIRYELRHEVKPLLSRRCTSDKPVKLKLFSSNRRIFF